MSAGWLGVAAGFAVVAVVIQVLIKSYRPSVGIDLADEPDPARDISARPCWPQVEMGNRLEREVAPFITEEPGHG
jgi:hypothetical protein